MAFPYIPIWLIADNNGGLKLINTVNSPSGDPVQLKDPALKYTLDAQVIPTATIKPIHRLASGTHAGQNMIAVARADATTFLCDRDKLSEGHLCQLSEWTEPSQRFNATQSAQDAWTGLDICSQGVLQCTKKGRARFTTVNLDNGHLNSNICNLPLNIRHCKASPSGQHFAYGGTEVNLSVWSTESTFATTQLPPLPTGGKRARQRDQLFPGEIWRAKNVSHDSLDLRQPVDITSLAYLSADTGPHQNIAVGNTLGCVHRYDTREGRKPASSWTDSRMSGGISLVEKGLQEHELLVADCGTQLWTIDMRKPSGPLYAYKGLSGKVTAIATSPSGFSTAGSLDRYVRLLTSPPNVSGDVVGKLYVTSAPTAVVPIEIERRPSTTSEENERANSEGDGEGEDWGEIQEVSSDEEALSHGPKKKQRKN